jgi:hypothetical protein
MIDLHFIFWSLPYTLGISGAVLIVTDPSGQLIVAGLRPAYSRPPKGAYSRKSLKAICLPEAAARQSTVRWGR